MYLSEGQLVSLTDDGLEAAYGFARSRQKTAWHARDFGMARSWEKIAGQCTRELLKRELDRWTYPESDERLF